MRHSPGFSLLLSMLVLSAIIIATISAGTMILRELKLTASGVRGIQAFYVAESGLEQALFEYRQKGTPSEDLAIEYDSGEEVGTGTYWRNVIQTTNEVKLNLYENRVIEIPLFDPADSSIKASSVEIAWDKNSTACSNPQFAWLEVVKSYWFNNDVTSVRELFSPSAMTDACLDNTGICPTVTFDPSSDFPVLRVRALFGDACNLQIAPDVSLPAQLQLTSTGEVGDAQQALTITVPTKAPQFGAFDYTIFSEESICKKGGASSTFCD